MGYILERAKERSQRVNYINYKKHSHNFDHNELRQLSGYILSDSCTADLKLMTKKKYKICIPTIKKVNKKGGGFRKIYIFDKKDIMIVSYLVYLLNLETPFLDCLYSFLPNRSIFQAVIDIKKVFSFRGVKPGYKIDLKGYDQNIDKDISKEQCEKHIKDCELLSLFKLFIDDNCYYEDGVLKSNPTGIRSGISFANYIENIYLHDLDCIIAQKASKYSRFGDDMIFFSNSQKDLDSLKERIFHYLKNCKLVINKEKSYSVDSHNFDYLGCTIVDGKVGLSISYYERIKKLIKNSTHHFLKIKRLLSLSDDNAMSMAINYFKNFVKAYGSNFSVVNKIEDMKQVDHIIQDSIRTIGTGKFSDARYRVRISKLHELGYRTIVNEYFNCIN